MCTSPISWLKSQTMKFSVPSTTKSGFWVTSVIGSVTLLKQTIQYFYFSVWKFPRFSWNPLHFHVSNFSELLSISFAQHYSRRCMCEEGLWRGACGRSWMLHRVIKEEEQDKEVQIICTIVGGPLGKESTPNIVMDYNPWRHGLNTKGVQRKR